MSDILDPGRKSRLTTAISSLLLGLLGAGAGLYAQWLGAEVSNAAVEIGKLSIQMGHVADLSKDNQKLLIARAPPIAMVEELARRVDIIEQRALGIQNYDP